MTRRFVVAAAAACALLSPAAAQAGTPFTIGEGNSPNVWTQPDTGTAHVVWENEADHIAYCQVPRGTTSCTESEDLGTSPPSGYIGETFLVKGSGTTLYAVMPVYPTSRTWLKTSTDNGLTWTPNWSQIYNPSGINTTANQPFLMGGEFIIPVSSGQVYGAATGGGESAVTTYADFDNIGYDTAAVPLGGASALLVGNDLSTTRFRTLKPGFDPSANASWNAETPVSGPLGTTELATGSAGTFLFGSGEGVGGGRPEIRKWNGTNFDAPIAFDNDTAYINGLTVGPAGVAAIWRKNDSASPGNRLQMAFSGSGGVPGSWTVRTIARGTEVMDEMNISLAADNLGWVTYEGAGGGATSRIRLVDTTTAPEPPAAPAPVTPVTPAPTPPKPLPVPVTPKKTKSIKVSSSGADITLGVPNQCIPSGKPFTATLTWKKQKRKGNKFVKVSRADFYVGKTRLKIDKKAPFKQTLKIPNPKKGKSYSFRARAFIKVSKGKSPKKSITTTLKVCS